MVDITHKSNTLREATAEAIVRVSDQATVERIRNRDVPKGDVFEMARAAGLLGVKKTPELLPDCHPLPIEYARIDYEIKDLEIRILMTVRTVYKTGVEVEAMHGASVVALTIYDMLKPIDKQVEIGSIRLLRKKGGKADYQIASKGLSALVVVCSDSVEAGEAQDRSGEEVIRRLEILGISCDKAVVPDEASRIVKALMGARQDLIVFTGGTGVAPRDVTPQAIEPLLDIRLSGVEEQMRRYGQDRMPYAMLSRSLAGVRDGKLVLVLPGSTKGVAECMDAVFPQILHVFSVLTGKRHES